MTTILADAKAGLMVADSMVSDGEKAGRIKKVYRIGRDLIGFAGNVDEAMQFLAWYRAQMNGPTPKMPNLSVLALTREGLFEFVSSPVPMPVDSGIEAIGTGAVAALSAYEALGWRNPRRAVQIVCRHDARSRGPVRVYKL